MIFIRVDCPNVQADEIILAPMKEKLDVEHRFWLVKVLLTPTIEKMIFRLPYRDCSKKFLQNGENQ